MKPFNGNLISGSPPVVLPQAVLLAGVAIVYLIVTRLGLLFVAHPEGIATIWPASGLALAILLLNPKQQWSKLLTVIFFTNAAGNVIGGNALPVSLGYALANTLEAVLGAWVLNHFYKSTITFERTVEIITLFGVAIVCNGITSIVGAAISVLAFGVPFLNSWLIWWSADGLGIILVTPIIVNWVVRPDSIKTKTVNRLIESLLFALLLAVFTWLLFGSLTIAEKPLLRNFMFFPILIWSAFRYSLRGMASTLLLVAVIAIWNTMLGTGIFAFSDQTVHEHLISVQVFLIVLVFSGLLLSTMVTELKKAEKALRNDDMRLRRAENFARFGNWEMSLTDTTIHASDGAKNIYGFSENEIALNKVQSVVLPEYRSLLDKALKELIEQNKPYDVEYKIRNINEEKIFDIHSKAEYDADNKIIFGIFQDITKQKQAEELLHHGRNLLTETERIGKVGGWEFNIDTLEQTWTEEMYLIHEVDLTYKPSVELGMNFYTPASRPTIEKAVQQAIEQGEPFDVDLEIITAKGNLRSVHASGRVDSTQRRVFGFFQDITDRRRTEKALRESEEIFRQFMEHSPVYVFFKDQNIRPTRLSRNFETMLRRPIDEVLGKTMDDLFPSDLAKSMIADDKQILNGGKQIEIEEELNGRYYLTTKFPIDVDEKPRYLAGFTLDITERKKAEKKLKEIITKNPMSIQILDKDGFTLEVNNSFKVLFGSVPPPGYSIFNDIQFAHQGLSEIFEKLRTGQIVHFPDVCFNPHDSVPGLKDVSVWTRTIGFPLNDSNDKPEQYVLMHDNITERKQAEEALKSLATTFADLSGKPFFEAISRHMAVSLGVDFVYVGEYNTTSNTISVLGGCAHGEPMGDLVYSLDDTPCKKVVGEKLCIYPTAVQSEFPNDLLLTQMGVEGYLGAPIFDKLHQPIGILVALHSAPLQNQQAIVRIFNTFVDRVAAEMQRGKAEEALRESEEKFAKVFRDAPVLIAITDLSNGIYLDVNEQALQISGFTREEVIGHTAVELGWITSEDRARLVKEVKHNGVISGLEMEFHAKEGRSINGLVNGEPIVIGGQPCLLTVTIDITERKNSEQALRNAQKLESIGTLAGGIAHDFNNLMNAVLGQSALALNKLPKESPAVNHITKAIKASERVADLTRQLLAYSGRGKFLVDEIDLNNLVKENVQILEVSIPKTTRLRYELGSPSPHIMGDISQIQQVIMNLIINAGEAMVPNPGQITLRTNRIELTENNTEYSKYSNTPLGAGSYALLQVSDTGSGISQETLARIFDPFFTTKFTGRGLGLAAVLGIIKGHKGGLRIESEVGKGTMFEIVLPLIGSSAVKIVVEKKELPVLKGEERTILVIDDESSVIELLEDLLSAVHFKVIGASDPLEGIERYRQEHQNISMVILDYSMPVMDGKAAFEELLKINKDVKVLLCSGYNEEETLSSFGTERPTGFFQKPYKIDALVERVSKILLD